MIGRYREVVEPKKLVFTTGAFVDDRGEPLIESLNTITLSEREGKTEVEWHEVVVRSSPKAAAALEGMAEGSRRTLDRLARFMEKN
jgi:uncharacterized protein YndB with AHSA1/START domain